MNLGAWAWGRDNNYKDRATMYKVWAPWPAVKFENDRYVARQRLWDIVISPFGREPEEPRPESRIPSGPPRVRKEPFDRFTAKDPFLPRSPSQTNTDPPGRFLRGPHTPNLMDMVRTVAKLRTVASKLRQE
jgi:hypothetical protein